MALHPEQRKRHFPEEAPVAWDPIRRDLEENEDWYRDLVEHSKDLLCVHDLEGRFLSVNPAPAGLLGYSVEEMLQKPMRDFVDPQFRSQFDVYLREIERTGESRGLLAVITRSGEQRIWEYHNTLRTEGVETPIVRGIAHDVTERVRAEKALRASNEKLLKTAREREQTLHDLTLFRTLLARAERKQAEETLHESERRYRLLFSEMVVGFALIEPIYDENGKPCDYRYLEVNPAFETHSGLPRNRVLGKTLGEVLPTLDPFWFETYGKVATTGESIHLEKYAQPLEKWLELVAFRTHQGQVAVTFADITKRKRAEEALRESELRFRTVYERSPLGIALMDSRTGRYLQVNPKFCEITGRSEEELLHCDVGSITHPDDIAESREYLQQLAEGTLANQELEKRYLRPDGSVRWVSILVARMWGDGETPRWNMSLVRDITERKQSEEALRESERRQQLALQIGKIGAFELDLKSGRGTWTAEFAEIWGIPSGFAGNFATFFSWELVHPKDRARVKEEFAQLVQSREEGESEFRVIRPDGVVRWIRGRGLVIRDTASRSSRVAGVILDITEHKRAQRSEERRVGKEC